MIAEGSITQGVDDAGQQHINYRRTYERQAVGSRLSMDLQSALSQLLRPVPHLAAIPPLPLPLLSPSSPSSTSTTLQAPFAFPFTFPLPSVDPTALLSLTRLDEFPPCAIDTPTKKCKVEVSDSPCSPVSSHSSTVSSAQLCSPQNSPIRKPSIPVPDEKKDDAYYERRRRNNTAAKRSRDARRQKEEAVAARAAILQQENIQLRTQVALLKSESAKLQLLLFSNATTSSCTPPTTTISTKEEESDETLDV